MPIDLFDGLLLAGMVLYGLWGAVRWRWPRAPRELTARDRQRVERLCADHAQRGARRLQRVAARQLARQRAAYRNGGCHG